MKINKNYLNLQESYLFSTIAHKVNEYKAANPQADVALELGTLRSRFARQLFAQCTMRSMRWGRPPPLRAMGLSRAMSF